MPFNKETNQPTNQLKPNQPTNKLSHSYTTGLQSQIQIPVELLYSVSD